MQIADEKQYDFLSLVHTALGEVFSQFPHKIMWKLCEAAGMPEGLLGLLQTFHGTLVERFRLGEGRVGEGFAPGRGICQGCPLGVLLVNVLFAVLVELTRTSVDTDIGVDAVGVVASSADDCTFWVLDDSSVAVLTRDEAPEQKPRRAVRSSASFCRAR